MSIPDFQSLMLPLLVELSDGKERHYSELADLLAKRLQVSEADRKVLLKSGQKTFDNRVGWAKSYLTKAGLLESTRRAHVRITTTGLSVLATKPDRITSKFLGQFDSFKVFQKTRHDKKSNLAVENNQTTTPEELLESGYSEIRENLARDLLNQVMKISPGSFEKLVVELLVRMGYGGSIQDAGEAIGKSGDEGIDGIIKEDKLGLDKIYIQAKRWVPDNAVGSKEVRNFVGSVVNKRAKKGVFITTSKFTSDAMNTDTGDIRVVKIDGKELANYMIDYNLGVSTVSVFEIKRIDNDYFDTL